MNKIVNAVFAKCKEISQSISLNHKLFSKVTYNFCLSYGFFLGRILFWLAMLGILRIYVDTLRNDFTNEVIQLFTDSSFIMLILACMGLVMHYVVRRIDNLDDVDNIHLFLKVILIILWVISFIINMLYAFSIVKIFYWGTVGVHFIQLGVNYGPDWVMSDTFVLDYLNEYQAMGLMAIGVGVTLMCVAVRLSCHALYCLSVYELQWGKKINE